MIINYQFKNSLLDFQKENLTYIIKYQTKYNIKNISFDEKNVFIDVDEDNIKEEIIELIKNFDISFSIKKHENIYEFDNSKLFESAVVYQELIKKGLIYQEANGVYLYFGIVQKVYERLQNYLRSKLDCLKPEEVYIPSLLRKETLTKTDYVNKNKNILNYVFNNQSSDCDLILNSAACLPLYKCLKDKVGQSYTGFCRVFRYEGNNYKELSRLREYGVREYVFLGNEEQVEKTRQVLVNIEKQIVEELNLTSRLRYATDMFFEDEFLAKSAYQISKKTKIELQIKISQDEWISAGSINMHGDFFTRQWNIKNKNNEFLNTLCLGFGIERFMFALFVQHGLNISQWPKGLKELLLLNEE